MLTIKKFAAIDIGSNAVRLLISNIIEDLKNVFTQANTDYDNLKSTIALTSTTSLIRLKNKNKVLNIGLFL